MTRPDQPPTPPDSVSSDDPRLGAGAIARALRVELLGLERGLLGQMLSLVLRPGATSAHLVDEAPHPLATAMRLFLVANLIFFVVGPSVGLMNYSLDSLVEFPGYLALVQNQVARLGLSADVYRARFETAFDFRQPTLVIAMVPVLLAASALALRRVVVGRHLLVALLGVTWILLVWPLLRFADGLAAELGAPFEVMIPLVLTLLAGSALWVWARLGAGTFALGRWGALGYGAVLTAATVAALVLHGQITFWVTVALLEFGG